VVEGIYHTDLPQYAVSNSGTLSYIPDRTGLAAARSLVWVDRHGKEEPITAAPGIYYSPKISPDGKQVALSVGESPRSDIWTWDLNRKNLVRLTFGEGDSGNPLWSSDGKRIVFSSGGEGGVSIC